MTRTQPANRARPFGIRLSAELRADLEACAAQDRRNPSEWLRLQLEEIVRRRKSRRQRPSGDPVHIKGEAS